LRIHHKPQAKLINPAAIVVVIPAQAGIQLVGLISLKINLMHNLHSRLRGNDGGVIDCRLNIYTMPSHHPRTG
jgi:hypothetical protein